MYVLSLHCFGVLFFFEELKLKNCNTEKLLNNKKKLFCIPVTILFIFFFCNSFKIRILDFCKKF